MRPSKRLASGIVAVSLLCAGGAPALAKSRRRLSKVAPAMPTGVTPSTGSGSDAGVKPGTIREYRNALGQTVYEIAASQFDVSAPLADMATLSTSATQATELEPSSNPQLPSWRIVRSSVPDPVVQPVATASESLSSGGVAPAAPTTGFNFNGIGISGGSPSDSNGSVGYDGVNAQYVETVNTRYQVWNLNHAASAATSALGPSNINTLWSGFGGACQTQNSGDPMVLYDKVANRWLISQFTSSASGGVYYQCVAVSTTSNATGTYARWAFAIPSGFFGDYPHIGVWSDAYYMMAHAFAGTSYQGAIFAAMDRAKMLAGNAGATWQVIVDPTEGGHQPADLDGFTPPPTNAPGIFVSLHNTGMYLYRMKVDFVNPGNTVKTLQASMPIAPATAACGGGTCIPQPGTTATLDSLADRLMFRAAYRNYVDHESLTVSHSVDPSVTGVVSGVRWYDFRLSGQPDAVCPSYPCVRQQGTVADVANGRSRWMPSVAMDGAENMLVGYSTTGKTNNSENQSVRYTGRAKTDPLNTMTAPEATIATGTKNNTSNSRWGDYSSMSVDPFDDCTFWYVAQYIPTTTSSWSTKIASATFPAGTGAGQCQQATCTSRPAGAPVIGSATVTGPNQIAVTWTGIVPQPGSYAIERAVGACGNEGLYQPLTSVPGANGSFTDTTVQGGFTYSYRVIAATDAAGKCQALSASGCVSAAATGNCTLKPSFTGAASGTSAGTASCGVTVSWTPATSGCPLTPNVKYDVYRGTTPDFVPSAGNRIAACVTGPSSYLDTANVSSGVTYYYAVRAEDDSTGNGGECGGNEDANTIVVSGTAYGPGTQASPGTWSDGGGDGTAFLQLNVADLGDTPDQAWRFVSNASDPGANHTAGGAYAYRNTGPTSASTYMPDVCAEMQTPSLTVGTTTLNLTYWERHHLEYHWDGVAVEYQVNNFEWNDVPAPSNSTTLGCAASDTLTGWETFSCTTATPANACGYSVTKPAYNGPLGSGTSCTDWATSATGSAYAHRCHQITGLTPGDTIKFRWRFSSDPAAQYGGFYLDDIAVTNIRLPNACSSNPCLGQLDGTSCSDGNACTTGDSCQAGVCTAGTPTVCSAIDACHVAGACNPATGICSNPNAVNGTACADGNACTQTDTCQNGACAGSNPVVCTASDACHVAGACNPATGVCSNPNAANGTSCSDGNACTTGDTCQAGTCASGAPVVCAAQDACHVAGTCDTGTGLCSNPSAADGTACSDGNACTQTDACQGGVCLGSNAVVCAASDTCHVAGSCNPATGVCSNPNAANGTACNDANACTQTDSCQGGVCTGSNPVVCSASDQCHVAGVCNPSTGGCSNPEAPNGAACSDGNACTQTDSCQGGSCVGSNAVVCTASDPCHVAGVCSPFTGGCSNPNAPNGTACSDGNACTSGDACSGGACNPGAPIVCNDNNACTTDGCSPASGCVFANNTDPCDDGDPCTVGDACGGGVCNSGATITAPPETAGVAASGDKATYSWSAAPTATRYDVVRGGIGQLPVGPGGGDEVCFGNLAGPTLIDATAPAAGDGFWYLSRGDNACGIGTLGSQSNGSPRTTATCP